MQIRRFQGGEAPALHRLRHDAIHQIAARDYTPQQIAAWAPATIDAQAWAEKMAANRPFIAEMDGQIVGFADVQPSGYIDYFFVSAEHPRQGIGNALMARLHEEAARQGMATLTSDVSRTAQPFFLHHGFAIVEQRQPVRQGVVVPNAFMRKHLQAPTVPAA
ncbi:MAG: GNAT family N-acetyltransferase [Rhodoferax sp.]|jgi:putative acetyltransferase|nr:GNAT family N-acetyltransferase [Rhodoferax sp.]